MSKTPVKRGRPAGMRARQLELKQTLLEHPDVPKVLEKVVSAALDDEHKNQAVAQKLVMDRLLPISTFDKKFDNRESVKVTISVIDAKAKVIDGEVVEQCADDT